MDLLRHRSTGTRGYAFECSSILDRYAEELKCDFARATKSRQRSLDILVTESLRLRRNGCGYSLHHRPTCDHVDVARRWLDVDCRKHGLAESTNGREGRFARGLVRWVQGHRDVELRSNARKRKRKGMNWTWFLDYIDRDTSTHHRERRTQTTEREREAQTANILHKQTSSSIESLSFGAPLTSIKVKVHSRCRSFSATHSVHGGWIFRQTKDMHHSISSFNWSSLIFCRNKNNREREREREKEMRAREKQHVCVSCYKVRGASRRKQNHTMTEIERERANRFFCQSRKKTRQRKKRHVRIQNKIFMNIIHRERFSIFDCCSGWTFEQRDFYPRLAYTHTHTHRDTHVGKKEHLPFFEARNSYTLSQVLVWGLGGSVDS